MPRFWTCHWQNRYWRDDINPECDPLWFAGSNNFRKRGVTSGDVVYIVSLADRHLLLGGRITVKEIVSREEAIQLVGRDDLYEAREWVIGDKATGTPLNLHRRLAPPLSRRLYFIAPESGPKGLVFDSDTDLNVQTTRGIRELTRAASGLLDQILALTDPLPRSSLWLTVTEDLLHEERFMATENPFGLPLDVAAIVLPLAADVIQYAATVAGGKWGLTDYMPDIRINVGFTEILTTQEEQLRLIVDRQLVDERILPRAVSVTSGPEEGPYYPSIPHSVLIEVPYRPLEDLAPIIAQVRPSLYAAIAAAGRRAVGRGVRMGHAPDMVRELARFLNRDLPQPGYDVGTASASTLPEAVSGSDLMEGALHRVTANRFERNPVARRACIAHYGTSCVVCGFSFEKVFGLRGRGFIHVHHLSPLARQQGSYTVDPIRDLRPVCPNCHAMLHRDDPPTSIDDLREELRRPEA